jgi:DNA-damage-inducible protein D
MSNLPTQFFGRKSFEDIKHVNEYNAEFWYARELMPVLEYSEWRNFNKVIEKAKKACIKSKNPIEQHFVDFNKKVELGLTTQREIEDYILSRYACYLIAQNGDSNKVAIAEAQTYFAIQTRKQELIEQLPEDEKRVYLRNQAKSSNKKLNKTAYEAGVRHMGTFHDWGYMGLYGWKRASQIKEKKNIKGDLLDHMGATELAANLFRITQTDDKLKKDEVNTEHQANQTHWQIGVKVRKTIEDIGGAMPEDLPPEEDIKKLEKRLKEKNQQAILQNKTKELPQQDADLGLFKEIEDQALNPDSN